MLIREQDTETKPESVGGANKEIRYARPAAKPEASLYPLLALAVQPHHHDLLTATTSMFAAATSAATAFFKTSSISQNYVLRSSQTGSGSSTPGPSSTPSSEAIPPFTVGPWSVSEAVHKLNHNDNVHGLMADITITMDYAPALPSSA